MKNDIMKSLKIGVLMGGCSSERGISLKSGTAVFKALEESGCCVYAIDICSDNTKEIIQQIRGSQINFAFLTLHGRWGEDGRIQEILEQEKIPYTGSGVMASRLAMNKVATYQVLQKAHVRVPRHLVLEGSNSMRDSFFDDPRNLPFMVKPSSEGSSIGISFVDQLDQLKEAIQLAFQYDTQVIVEQFIRGKELTVGILDNKLLPVIEIRPKKGFFDFDSKYQHGMTDYIVPADIESQTADLVQRLGNQVHQLVGCRHLSRVDFMLTPDNVPFVLEINTIPGMTATSLLPKAAQAVGIDFTQLCLNLIQLAYGQN